MPDYLQTKRRETDFDMTRTEVPFINPVGGWTKSVFGGKEPTLRTKVVHTHEGPKIVFYNDEEGLKEALDDFLFS